jgi:8-oxo-dGTP diphosphatase/2-hydroxy-dATP diphosphatase
MAEEKQKLLTNLVLIVDDTRILLGKKKRGIGAGRYNGYGGKVDIGETVEESLVREVFEESGLLLTQYEKIGVLQLETPEFENEMHIFASDGFSGELRETEEMAPEWFSIEHIPYEEMWQSDPLWYPYFLGGEKFVGKVIFDENHQVIESEIQPIGVLGEL